MRNLCLNIVLLSFMTSLSWSASCPKLPHWIEVGDHCLKYYNKTEGWVSANKVCHSKGGNLITVHNTEIDEKLHRWNIFNKSKNEVWIGARVPALVHPSYFDKCVDGHAWQGRWCYTITKEQNSWHDAKSTCESMGGKLALVQGEENSKFIAYAVKKMTLKLSISNTSSENFSYWVDGRSTQAVNMDFRDSDGASLEYLKFKNQMVINATNPNQEACIEIFPNSFSNLSNDQQFQESNQTLSNNTGKRNATKLSYSFSKSQSRNFTRLPQFNMLQCVQKRIAVCQFNMLEPIKDSENKTEAKNNSTEHGEVILPSYIDDCQQLSDISLLSVHILQQPRNDNASETQILQETQRLKLFRELKKGYYLFKKSSNENELNKNGDFNSTLPNNVKQYSLEYCNVQRGRRQRSRWKSSYLPLYNWLEKGPNGDYTLNEKIATSHKLIENSKFHGPCVKKVSASNDWKASSCVEKLNFVCQFQKKNIRKNFCKDELAEDDLCKEYLAAAKSLLEKSNEMVEELKSKAAVDAEDFKKGIEVVKSSAKELSRTMENITDSQERYDFISSVAANMVLTIDEMMGNKAKYLSESKNAMLPYEVIDVLNDFSYSAADALCWSWLNGEEKYSEVRQIEKITENIALRITVGDMRFGSHYVDYFNFLKYSPPDDTRDSINIIWPDGLNLDVSDTNPMAIINVKYNSMATMAELSTDFNENINNDDITIDQSVFNISVEADTNDTDALGLDNGDYNPYKLKYYRIMATPVLTTTVRVNKTNIEVPVEYKMESHESDKYVIVNNTEKCVFIKREKYKNGTISSFSSDGCYARNYDNGHRCYCNHTTDFAVLLLVHKPYEDPLGGHRYYLRILSIIGEMFSVIFLITTIAIFTAFKRDIKSDRASIHVNLFASLLMAHLLLLVSNFIQPYRSVYDDDDALERENDAVCVAVTFMTHLTLLGSLIWMLVEGIVLYRKIILVMTREFSLSSKRFVVAAWVVPVLVACGTVTVGMVTDAEYNTLGCWLSAKHGVIWAFAVPAGLVVLVNMLIIIRVLMVAITTSRRRTQRLTDMDEATRMRKMHLESAKTAARGALFLPPLLGVTWLTGFLVIHFSTAYLFVGLNAFQGFYLFLLYVVVNPEVQAGLTNRWRKKCSKEFADIPQIKKRGGRFFSGDHRDSLTRKILGRLSSVMTSSISSNKDSVKELNKNNFSNKTIPKPEISMIDKEVIDCTNDADLRRLSSTTRSTSLSTSSNNTSLSVTSLPHSVASSDSGNAYLVPPTQHMNHCTRPFSSNSILGRESRDHHHFSGRPFSAGPKLSSHAQNSWSKSKLEFKESSDSTVSPISSIITKEIINEDGSMDDVLENPYFISPFDGSFAPKDAWPKSPSNKTKSPLNKRQMSRKKGLRIPVTLYKNDHTSYGGKRTPRNRRKHPITLHIRPVSSESADSGISSPKL